jgi:hypothetical protein
MTKTILIMMLINFIGIAITFYLNIYIIEKLYLEIISSILIAIISISIGIKIMSKKEKEIYKDR